MHAYVYIYTRGITNMRSICNACRCKALVGCKATPSPAAVPGTPTFRGVTRTSVEWRAKADSRAVPSAGGPGPKVTETGVSVEGTESRRWPCPYAYARRAERVTELTLSGVAKRCCAGVCLRHKARKAPTARAEGRTGEQGLTGPDGKPTGLGE